ncbi:long-chain-fatty-acid-CoA ligase/ protein binding protein [Mollisia scopiformis]|uniref:Long-chain-fatty-acid-CoA ligase/ protein binding protein n=1 Tax=Mollisia scopiformis TaxID=149040 RepID=A0A132B9W3_MOLSC|nr:long-chain-fatty-acid-CoA ligase/ protein binding protein [Mollisia scopiformis]KUJ09196.1 long-chain-fatty-acid-CoA ligase/ protein binding protein [Mollisia scopiformis]
MAPIQYPTDPDALVKALRVPPPPGTPYSLPIPGSEKEGRTPVYRHWRFVDSPLLQTVDPKILTAHDAFESTVKKRPNARCLGSRPWDPVAKTFGKYEWMTYAELASRRKNFGAGVVELHKKAGVTEEKYGVGLWCQNRPEWQISDLGCMSQSLFTVSIYDTLGPDTTEYIVNHATLTCVITSLPHIPTLLKLAPRIPSLKLIICLDQLDAGERPGNSKFAILNTLAADAGISIHYIEDVEALGAASGLPMKPPRPEDIITINYTSGTTGNPKGVVLTHATAVAATTTALVTSDTLPSDVLISYLPLAHIYQRVAEHGALASGASIGYFRGDILGLVDDMKILRPTGFNSVPRLYNRFGSAIRAATLDAPGLKGTMGRHVINTKLASMKLPPGQATNKHMLWDRIFTPKLASAFGLQRCRGMVSGSAPLDPSLQQFLRAAFGNDIIQGYGLTETYATGLAQLEGDYSAGNCGAMSVNAEACLQSVPDMDYLVTDSPNPRGELLIRGKTRFREYYKNEAETAKAIIEDGWFRTGDIAEIDSMGRFKIIDRVKNVLKLAQGEYISPERIENVYLANTNIISQAYVHGDSTQSFLVSVLGIDPIAFAPFASSVLKKTIKPEDVDAIKAAARDLRVRKAVVRELEKIGKKNKFNSYERVRNCHLELDPFTIENELLTPTLKLKRLQTAKRFRAEIDKMYADSLAEETPRAKL